MRKITFLLLFMFTAVIANAQEECLGAATPLAGAPATVTTIPLPIAGMGTIGAEMTDMITFDEVALNGLTYDMVNELVVTLTSPEGTTVTLFANDGGDSATGIDVVFTDNSANDVDNWDDAASFQPDFMAEGGSLNDTFDGEEINGDWTLTVTNGGANGGGTLNDFCLTFSDNGMVGAEPTIECPMDIAVDNDEDACGAVVNFADAIAIDDEDGVITTTQVADGAPVSGEEFPVGVTTVTFEATDSNGNTVMCSFDVTVNDVTEPTLECPATILVANDAGICGADVTVPNPTVTDNCEDEQPGTFVNDFNGTDDASDFYPVGTTTVEFTYTDAGGNTTTCTVDVTVEDTEAPVIACEGSIDDTVSEMATVGAAISNTLPATVSTITVTESQVITDVNVDVNINHTWVADMEITLTSPAGTELILFDQGCSANDLMFTFDDEGEGDLADCTAGTDNQAYPLESYVPSNPLAIFIGEDTAGDWTISITDTAGGDDGTFNSWGLDLMYEATPLPPFVVELDADGMGSVAAEDLLIDVTDNCGNTTVTSGTPAVPGQLATTDFLDFTSAYSGIMFDVNALSDVNVSSFDVDLFDRGGGGDANIEVYFKEGTFVGSEEVMEDWTLLETVTITPNAVGVADELNLSLGQTILGGTTGAFYVVVTTPFSPTAGWNIIALENGAAIGSTIVSNSVIEILQGKLLDYPFVDAIPDTGFRQNINVRYSEGTGLMTTVDFTCADTGLNTVTINATDDAGNTASCEAIVDVQDNIDPVIVCQDFTLELDDNGVATLDPLSLLDETMSTEACGFDIATADITEFDCSNIGTPTLVTIFVQDPSGNIASCSAMVTVVDVNGPVLTCPEDQTVATDEGTGTYIVEDFTALATATDGCSATPTISQDPAVGTELGVGTYTVTLTATDDLGNASTCTFQLTVQFDELGVEENELSNAIAMYPNPATAIVNLSNTSNIALDRAAIYDVNGKMVSDVNLDGLIGERAIDVSALASGVYIVQISGEGTTIAKRLIIE